MDNNVRLTRLCWRGTAGNLAGASSIYAGGLRSGLGASGPPLSPRSRLGHFRKHRVSRSFPYLERKHATALVSLSDRMLDTLKRAFNKVYEDDEPPEQVHILFVSVPQNWQQQLHAAMDLAEECGLPEPHRYRHEFLFEWSIPDDLVTHSVTIRTLMDREIRMDRFLVDSKLPPTSELRLAMAEYLFRHSHSPWDAGLSLGVIAKCFGANAPVIWIAQQLLVDTASDCSDGEYAYVKYPDGTAEKLDLSLLDDGIDTYLMEWWLLDESFLQAMKEYKYWCEIQEEIILDFRIDFGLVCRSRADNLAHTITKEACIRDAKVKRVEDMIEAEGVRIGL